jgi:perosamine synthetase
MHNAPIPFHRPSIGNEEVKAVTRVLASKWLTTGPETRQFEQEFAAYIGCKHALAVNSATAALQLALDCLGLEEGDEVLVPTYTFTATAEVVTYFRARPVLCDSVHDGFNIDIEDAARRMTARTKAIIPVHIAGEPCDMERVQEFAISHGLRVVEDAAHALPAKHRGRPIGTLSDLTAFSFYATKNITTGEGGMLVTDCDEYARRASIMRLHGISGDAWKRYSRDGSWFYEVLDAGYKLNLCDLLGAVGSAQLKKCDQFLERRRYIATRYIKAFSNMEELETPPEISSYDEHSWHLFILRVRPKLLTIDRRTFIEQLKEAGIGTSVHFIPLHLHPFYARTYGYKPGDFPNAEDAYSRAISLPIYPDLSEDEISRVIRAVERIVFLNRRSALVAA